MMRWTGVAANRLSSSGLGWPSVGSAAKHPDSHGPCGFGTLKDCSFSGYFFGVSGSTHSFQWHWQGSLYVINGCESKPELILDG